jgi:hypothetical protein
LTSNASIGIPWIGSCAVGKAAFMLMREVSVRADMVNNRSRQGEESSNKWGLVLDYRTVQRPQQEIQLINILKNYLLLLCIYSWMVVAWYVYVVFSTGQVLGN